MTNQYNVTVKTKDGETINLGNAVIAKSVNLKSGGYALSTTPSSWCNRAEMTLTMEAMGKLTGVLKNFIDDDRAEERFCMSLPIIMMDGRWVMPINVESIECTHSYGYGAEVNANVMCSNAGSVDLSDDAIRKIVKLYKNTAIAVQAILTEEKKKHENNGTTIQPHR